MKALDDKEAQDKILGNDEEYDCLVHDMRVELQKFGIIDLLVVPRVKTEKHEPGKVYVNFVNVASAFSCYNLLNGKPYMG